MILLCSSSFFLFEFFFGGEGLMIVVFTRISWMDMCVCGFVFRPGTAANEQRPPLVVVLVVGWGGAQL